MLKPDHTNQPPHLALVSAEDSVPSAESVVFPADEYSTLRAEVSDTAAALYARSMPARAAFRAAFAVVGEEVASTSVRQKLRYFYLGPLVDTYYSAGGLSGNNATTRMYVAMPPRERRTSLVATSEPMAVYLARKAMQSPDFDLSAELAPQSEEFAGAMFRAFTKDGRLPLAAEANLAVDTLLPLLAPDVQQTLTIGYEDYTTRLAAR